MASVLLETVHKGLANLDLDSPLAKEVAKIDIERVLADDVRRVCEAVSFIEIIKIISIVTKINSPSCKDDEACALKREMKEIAVKLVERIECGSGPLGLPISCRELLLDL